MSKPKRGQSPGELTSCGPHLIVCGHHVFQMGNIEDSHTTISPGDGSTLKTEGMTK